MNSKRNAAFNTAFLKSSLSLISNIALRVQSDLLNAPVINDITKNTRNM